MSSAKDVEKGRLNALQRAMESLVPSANQMWAGGAKESAEGMLYVTLNSGAAL